MAGKVIDEPVKRAVGDVNLAFVPHNKQIAALKAFRDIGKRLFLLDGGGRSGKTLLLMEWMIMRAIMYPGSRQIILRKARMHAEKSIWDETMNEYITEVLDKCNIGQYLKPNKEKLTMNFWNGSSIIIDGCDDEKRVRSIFGREYIGMWFNEASEFADFAMVEYLLTRVVQRVGIDPDFRGWKKWLPDIAPTQIYLDTNPKGPRHWLYKAGILHVNPEDGEPLPNADKWARVGGWTPYDNADNLADDAISAYEGFTGVRREQMLLGKWVDNSGAVYDEFDEDIHVCKRCKREPDLCPRIFKGDTGRFIPAHAFRSIDFGYKDPFVCLWGAIVDEQLLVYRSYYKRRKIVSVHAECLKAETRKGEHFLWTVADHDAEDAATLKASGVRNRPAKKDRPLMSGVQRVKKRSPFRVSAFKHSA